MRRHPAILKAIGLSAALLAIVQIIWIIMDTGMWTPPARGIRAIIVTEFVGALVFYASAAIGAYALLKGDQHKEP